MTDTGLSNRLRQHSRRSGIAVGLTMAVTIGLCILSSAYVFGQIEPYVAEVTGYDEPTAVPQVAAADEDPAEEENAPPEEEEQADSGEQPTEEAGDAQPTIAGAGETDDDFVETHTSNPDFTINFRPGPSVASGDPIGSLDPSTPLMFLDEEAIDEEGVVWLSFRTESGQEGWIREVDTQPVFQ